MLRVLSSESRPLVYSLDKIDNIFDFDVIYY